MGNSKIERKAYIGAPHLKGVELNFVSERYKGDPTMLDTEVIVNSGVLCTITGKDVEAFQEELQEVVRKYMI